MESEFRGQLPQPFTSDANATSIIPPNMNDENKEERSRYVSIILKLEVRKRRLKIYL